MPATKTDPPLPVIITPTLERIAHDIAIPITKPNLEHDIRKLSELRVEELDAIYDPEDVAELFLVTAETRFRDNGNRGPPGRRIATRELPPAHELLASITNKVINRAKAAEPIR